MIRLSSSIFFLISCVLFSACSNKIDIQGINDDIAIELPSQFVLLSQYVDWFGFDPIERYHLQFTDEDAEDISMQIQNVETFIGEFDGFNADKSISSKVPNSSWFTDGNGWYGYRSCSKANGITTHCIFADFSVHNNVLRYESMNF